MALVAYSDSEASESDHESTTPQPPQKPAPTPAAASTAKPSKTIVDRSNPRKIRVALPEIKPESSTRQEDEDGPARKKPRIGAGGGLSGFNALLPAPKRNTATAEKKDQKTAPARKVFSLKTGATPGFDRTADAELRNELALGGSGNTDEDETIPKAGSLQADEDEAQPIGETKPVEEVKLKGNPMMFKPLSVGRASQQKKKKAPISIPPTTTTFTSAVEKTKHSSQPPNEQVIAQPKPAPAPKPKISLFSMSTEDSSPSGSTQPQSSTYQPLVYNSAASEAPAGPSPEPNISATQVSSGPAPTLGNIADDLNLSRAQRRHLFGRNADSSQSRVLYFNTDTEYAANQELAHSEELAAAQHNPVRAIAPGKHSLQQLVNAASTQREALEESFATGRRNKKEAGSKYGW
ncbi:hypothetical protein FE257_009906 [Aspergillus nanangensis]|uniref:Mitotic checkpoint regulator, MAD2B-interacting-domain-containing protein n=1 Tax=Aspergillus nanangensis TaxID=2582783 RepID=A0AAD4CWD9_ASPNN|nr:hypothetical protein FE257_009906 [Aspergillus nanangensis]